MRKLKATDFSCLQGKPDDTEGHGGVQRLNQ